MIGGVLLQENDPRFQIKNLFRQKIKPHKILKLKIYLYVFDSEDFLTNLGAVIEKNVKLFSNL